MRTSGTRRKGSVEIQIELRIEVHIILCDFCNVNLVIAFGVDFSKVVFIQEIVAYNQTLFIVGKGRYSEVLNVRQDRAP